MKWTEFRETRIDPRVTATRQRIETGKRWTSAAAERAKPYVRRLAREVAPLAGQALHAAFEETQSSAPGKGPTFRRSFGGHFLHAVERRINEKVDDVLKQPAQGR